MPGWMVSVDQVRRFAMTLPRTTEALVGGQVTFRVGRSFTSLSRAGRTSRDDWRARQAPCGPARIQADRTRLPPGLPLPSTILRGRFAGAIGDVGGTLGDRPKIRSIGSNVAKRQCCSGGFMNITVAAEPFDSVDAQRLIAALDAHLASRYLPDQRFGPNLRPEQVATGLGTFVIARAGGRAVGCGALRRLDDTSAEVKRMYVEPELRGHGIARGILDHLEAAARAMGVSRLVLETGIYQAEAIGLYRRMGFNPVRCWGEYEGVLTSVCFEKTI
jgi:putative acetyltransferase